MHRIFGQFAIYVALFMIIGGHWAVFQCVAWGSMIVEYSQREDSLVRGLLQTFDGDHPCQMCHSISKAKQQERSEPLWSLEFQKLDKFLAFSSAQLPAPCVRSNEFHPAAGIHAPFRVEGPTPPVPIVLS